MSREKDLGAYVAIGTLLAGTAGTASPAWAQAQIAQAAPEQLEEVIVTAEKRATGASKTPIAMDVFTAEQREEL